MYEYEASILASWPKAENFHERLRVYAKSRDEMYDTIIAYVKDKGGNLHTIIRSHMRGAAPDNELKARVL